MTSKGPWCTVGLKYIDFLSEWYHVFNNISNKNVKKVKKAEFWCINVVVKAYGFIIMAHNSKYEVMSSSSFSYLNHKCSLIVRNVPKIPQKSWNLPYQKFFDFDARYLDFWVWPRIFFSWLWKIHSRTIDFRSEFKNPRIANSMASPFRYDRKKIESAISPNDIIGDPNFFLVSLRPLWDL